MKRAKMGILLRLLLNRYIAKLTDDRSDRVTQEMIDCGNFLLIEDERWQP